MLRDMVRRDVCFLFMRSVALGCVGLLAMYCAAVSFVRMFRSPELRYDVRKCDGIGCGAVC